MMRWSAALAFAAAMGAIVPASAAGVVGCDAFLEKLKIEGSEIGVDYTHALVVSRTRSDTTVFDVTTKADVEGALTCRGDRLLRFEMHIVEPASARAAGGFEKLAVAALRSALGWDASKIHSTLRDMSGDVKDYLAASKERGDVYIAGKTEVHAPGDVSLGLIQTEADRAFVIVGPSQ